MNGKGYFSKYGVGEQLPASLQVDDLSINLTVRPLPSCVIILP